MTETVDPNREPAPLEVAMDAIVSIATLGLADLDTGSSSTVAAQDREIGD